MAREFIEGWEHGDAVQLGYLGVWDGVGQYWTGYGGIAGMTGSYAFRSPNSSAYIIKNLSTAMSEIYFSFKFRVQEAGADIPMLSLHKGAGSSLIALRMDTLTNLTLEALVDTSQVAAGGVCGANVTYRIECYFKLADAGGRIVVKLDGVTVIDYTGDTKPGADTTFDCFRLGYRGAGGGTTANAYWDDFVVDNATGEGNWIGNSYIKGHAPTGAGATTSWDPSTGSNYACVDEIPGSLTDYVSTNVSNEVDTYACTDLPGTAGSVKCVQVTHQSFYEGEPTPTKVGCVVRTASTDYAATGVSVGASVSKRIQNLWETNPNTATAWQVSEVNGMEIGIKSLA